MLFTDFAIMVGMVYVYLPLMVLPLYASMEKIDFRLIEAGYDLYATRFKVLRRIIFPLVKPGVIAGSILVFIPSLGAYVTPSVLGGGKNMMLGNLIELQFGQGRNWPLGGALSITLMAIVMLALLAYVRNAGAEGRQRPARAFLDHASARLHRDGGALLHRALCADPLLVIYAFNAGNSIAIWQGFSLRWFETAWNNNQVIEASWRSLRIAAWRPFSQRSPRPWQRWPRPAQSPIAA